MNSIASMAASGMRARMESLEMLANNIANSSTGGFKSDREYYSLYVAPELQNQGTATGTMPNIERHWTDFAQGTLLPTGKSTDIGLTGAGFIGVDGPGGTLYTRNGNFQLTSSGGLVTADGYPVRLSGGQPLQLEPNSDFQVRTDGSVVQNGNTLGQLDVVEFVDPNNLTKQGASYFKVTDPTVRPVPARSTQVEQGQIEGSNTVVAQSAVRLVGLMRSFEMLQKAAGIDNDMSKKAIEEVARVGS
jgi:flagellar basal body rod protein FlgG